MWYFAWILGVLLACAFGIINVMWMETEDRRDVRIGRGFLIPLNCLG
jgi:cyd operon protein YbgT